MIRPPTQSDTTREKIIREGEWLTIGTTSASHSVQSIGLTRDLEMWEAAGEIFSIPHNGERYFARYQFDEYGAPLPVMKEVLDRLNEVMDPWSIAAWFAFPNSWAAQELRGTFVAVRPSTILDRREELLHAVLMVRGSYAA